MNMGARMQAHSWHGLPSDLVANAEPSGIPPMSSSLLVFFFPFSCSPIFSLLTRHPLSLGYIPGIIHALYVILKY